MIIEVRNSLAAHRDLLATVFDIVLNSTYKVVRDKIKVKQDQVLKGIESDTDICP